MKRAFVIPVALGLSFPSVACGGGSPYAPTEAGIGAEGAANGNPSDGSLTNGTGTDAEASKDSALDAAAGDATEDRAMVAADALSDALPDRGIGACTADAATTGVCNELVPQGVPIVSTCSTAAAPTPQGGAIQDGTYVLDGITYYGACPREPDVGRYTWQICGSSWATAQEVPRISGAIDAGLVVQKFDVIASVQAEVLTVTPVCASMGTPPAPQTWRYTASPGQLVFYLSQTGAGMRADAYRPQ
jgi:hypothetical protein